MVRSVLVSGMVLINMIEPIEWNLIESFVKLFSHVNEGADE